MAIDANTQLKNMYNAAQSALNDDLKQQYYNATQTRTQAFRQLNNGANAKHAMYSGAPAAAQMQYDQQTYIPGAISLAERALAKQQQNQEAWDSYMDYIKQLQSQTDYYNQQAQSIASSNE